MGPHVEGLRRRGVDAVAIDLPVGRAERAVPVFARHLAAAGADVVIGGHSYGGRVASMLAAGDEGSAVAGLVLLSYPLHRPGHPDDQRTEHWGRIRCPVLLLSGESDPFAGFELLGRATELLGDAELVGYPRVGHGLAAVLDDALDRVASFVQRCRGG
jgi:predicted alpha/beta-hydrolase family hydrolase